MHFPDTADKKKDDVKEELKGDTVKNADGTDGTEKTGNVKSDNKQNTEGADKTGGHNR